jgi:hypothetical protein
MARSTEHLAHLMAAGFRMMRVELQAQRTAIAQLQEAVVQYSRSVEQRDEARLDAIQRLQAEVQEIKRKGSH